MVPDIEYEKALDLIKKQQAEIERLQKEVRHLRGLREAIQKYMVFMKPVDWREREAHWDKVKRRAEAL